MTQTKLKNRLEIIKSILVCVLLLVAILSSLQTKESAEDIASSAFMLKNIVQPANVESHTGEVE